MDLLLLSARVLLAVIFAFAGGAKAFDREGSKKALSDFGIPKPFAGPAALMLPIAELATAILLLTSSGASWGAIAGFALLAVFAAAIAINLVKGRAPECHCFGQFHSRPISWGLVTRNAMLALAAGTILWQGPGMSIGSLARRLTEIAMAQPLPVAAAALSLGGVLVQVFLVLGLFQQHGRLMLRVDKIEQLGHAGDGADSLAPPLLGATGLPVGTPAPSFELWPGSSAASLEDLLISGRPAVVVFTDPNCGPCRELLPDIARWERQFSEMIRFVIVSRASAESGEWAGGGHEFRNIAWQESREIAESYKINGTPAAIVVRPDGMIGSWLASGRVAIQALVTFLVYARMLVGTEELVSKYPV